MMKPALAALALLALCATASADIYRWTDSTGKVYFDTSPPTDPDARDVTVTRTGERAKQPEPAGKPSSVRILTDMHVGCLNRANYETLVRYTARGDKSSFEKALFAFLAGGGCTVFKSGEEVTIRDTDLPSGMVRISRPDELKAYWTGHNAIFKF